MTVFLGGGWTVLLSTIAMEVLPSCRGLSGCYSLRVRLVEAFAKVFLVEPHGGDDAARRPIDHHISQQIIQRELPARHHIHKIFGYSNDNNGFTIRLPNVSHCSPSFINIFGICSGRRQI